MWPLGAGAALKKYQEPEPLGENIRSRSGLKKKSGAGAATILAGSVALYIVYSYVQCMYTPEKVLYCNFQRGHLFQSEGDF